MSVCQMMKALKTWELSEQQQRLVDSSGLGNLVHTSGLVIDCYVLTAFCEFWSVETNTAQFHGFEMAPSLRDTAYILGVPVMGHAVTTGAVVDKTAEQLCSQYLGRRPGCKDCRDGHVKLSWLYSEFSQLLEYPTDNNIACSTRAYLLYLIGSTLLPEKEKGYVSPKYLVLLSDFAKIREYAWGAAALARLYRSLSIAATSSSTKRLFGSSALLMGWIYEYLPMLRPDIEDLPASSFPCSCRWIRSTISRSRKKVPEIRKTLNLLQISDVNWEPYKDMDRAIIPRICIAPDNICFSRTWLISFNLKEIYVPDRYARQFGREQYPLIDVPKFQRRHWSASVDWSLEYASEIEQFQQLVNAGHPDHITISAVGGVAELFVPATIAQAALGLNLMSMAESIKKEFPIITRFLVRQPLPVEVARSLARMHELVEAYHNTQCDSTPSVQQTGTPQHQLVSSNPPTAPASIVHDPDTTEVVETLPDQTTQHITMTDSSVPEHFDLPKRKKRKRWVRDKDPEWSENHKQRQVVKEAGVLRRSGRQCVQIKRFKHRKGKGSRSCDPILL